MTATRFAHYSDFYGAADFHGSGTATDDRPLLVVYGNCQAEALRVLLDSPEAPWRTARLPPVHELRAADLRHVHDIVAATSIVVIQPVRDGYHSLPLGTRQVLALQPSAQAVVVPVIRHAALYPHQLLVRAPAGDPPGVPYHDVRTMIEAHTGVRPELTAAGVRSVAAISQAELRRREVEFSTVQVSDLLVAHGPAAANTINHPGNPVLIDLATRVRARLGWTEPAVDPGRVLLRSVIAPLEPLVIDALDLTASPRPDWLVDGLRITDDEIRAVQLPWYARHPEVLQIGLDRHADLVGLLRPQSTPVAA